MNLTQVNRKASHIYGFGGLILLSCSYYPKQFKDSTQFLLKSQQNFFQIQKVHPTVNMESQRTPNRQKKILEQKSWRHLISENITKVQEPKSVVLGIKCVLSCSVVLTLCDLLACSPPGSSVQGISQARILEWVALCFFRGSS